MLSLLSWLSAVQHTCAVSSNAMTTRFVLDDIKICMQHETFITTTSSFKASPVRADEVLLTRVANKKLENDSVQCAQERTANKLEHNGA